jgi:hypothetical protein
MTDEPKGPQRAADKRPRRAEAVREERQPIREERQPAREAAPQAQQAAPDMMAELRREMRAEMKQMTADTLVEHMRQTFPERSGAIGARPEIRQPVRATARQAVRGDAREIRDRQGNVLVRRGSNDGKYDPFKIPDDLAEKGWDRQWIRCSVIGQEDISNQVMHQENGWRPINADRAGFRGRFMPHEYKGAIVKDGLMLVERPMALTEQAKDEDNRRLREQTRQQRENFGLALPSGFTAETPKARAHTGIKVGRLEAAPADLQPKYELADGDMEY